jgi:peptide/nickel transport system substrate-binding protein
MKLIHHLKYRIPHRFVLWFFAALMAVGLVAACGPQTTTPYGESTSSVTNPTEQSTATAATGGSTLRLLYWQAPTTLNPHLSTGIKDREASSLILEPLAAFDENEALEPILAAEIPSLENGGLGQDNRSVTWKLREGVKWSDGTPFTAEDVVFTYEFISNPDTGSTSAEFYGGIDRVEAIDPQTVRITFSQPTSSWSQSFVGGSGMILPKHIFQEHVGAKARSAPGNTQPVGTGPYRATEFKAGDIIIYEPNLNFRGDKPYFDRVELKGGGDAVSAGRAVLQTGGADFGWNIQAEPAVIQGLEAGGKGKMEYIFKPLMERILINFSDPNQEVDGQRSHAQTKHPFLTDKRVRQAISLAIDRDTIVKQLYGQAGQVATNFIVAPSKYVSPNTRYEFSLDQAKALLDEAGWVDSNGNGIRDKNGVEMSLLFQTSVNPVRQKTQEIMKQNLSELGMQVELKSTDPSIYFGDPSNPDSSSTFYADLQMFAFDSETPEPDSYMMLYACDAIAQKENQWSKENISRYCNPDYDQLLAQLNRELDPDRRQQLFIQMNDLLIEDVALIPLVHRSDPLAVSHSLSNLEFSPWAASTWRVNGWGRQ